VRVGTGRQAARREPSTTIFQEIRTMAETKNNVEDIAILEEAVATNVGTVGTPK
jgi:hypothetical protein